MCESANVSTFPNVNIQIATIVNFQHISKTGEKIFIEKKGYLQKWYMETKPISVPCTCVPSSLICISFLTCCCIWDCFRCVGVGQQQNSKANYVWFRIDFAPHLLVDLLINLLRIHFELKIFQAFCCPAAIYFSLHNDQLHNCGNSKFSIARPDLRRKIYILCNQYQNDSIGKWNTPTQK